MSESVQQYMVKDAAGNIYGPATIPMLRQWIAEHRIIGSMMIAPQGTEAWQIVANHPELSALVGEPPSNAPAAGIQSEAVNPYSTGTELGYATPPMPGRTDPLAIASLVTGIISIPGCLCCPIGGVAGVGALILGFIALQNMRKDPAVGGRGLAIAGIITGGIGVCLTLLVVAFWFLGAISHPTRV